MRAILLFILLFNITFAFSQDSKFFEDKADLKFKKGDYQYAMVMIDKAITLNQTDQFLKLKKADIQYELTGPIDAIAIIEKAISNNPKMAILYNRVSKYYNSAGMLDSAINRLNLAIKYAENDEQKYASIMNRGTANAGRRHFKEALADYETVLDYNPNNLGTLNNIATIYRQLGNTDKAIKCLEKAITIDSTLIGPYINLGFAYSKIDKLEMAINYFDLALKINPEEPLIYSNRGHTYYKMGDNYKALADINKSIKLYPTNSYAYRNLALVYIDMKKMDEACTALNYALDYGFTPRYGDEVQKLQKKHCK